MKKIQALALIAAAFGVTHKNESGPIPFTKQPEFEIPSINAINQDHLSIARAGDFNKRNNKLFSLRIKSSRSYIPKNSKNN